MCARMYTYIYIDKVHRYISYHVYTYLYVNFKRVYAYMNLTPTSIIKDGTSLSPIQAVKSGGLGCALDRWVFLGNSESRKPAIFRCFSHPDHGAFLFFLFLPIH